MLGGSGCASDRRLALMQRLADDLPHRDASRLLDARPRRLARLKTRRKIWLQVHLWLGLVLGLFLAIFGITGSLLVFHQEIDEWLNPALLTVSAPPGTTYRPLAEIFKSGQAAAGEGALLSFAHYPRNAQAAFKLSFKTPSATPGLSEGWQVGVDPYTAQVTGKRLTGSSDSLFPKTFIGLVFELHYALLLPVVGGDMVGVMACLLVFSVLTGLVVWWPLTGQWRKALTVKRRASPQRLNHDLHKTFGFYTAPVLAVVLLSGIALVFPERFVSVVELFSPATYRYFFHSAPRPGLAPLGMAEAVGAVEQRYPAGRVDWIYGAPEAGDAYTVCKRGLDLQGSWLDRICVVVDRQTGEYLDVDDPSRGRAGEVFMQWQWPLHSGQAFGWPGRIMVCLTGLACPVLAVTGWLRWLQKRRARLSRTSQ